MLYSKPCEYAIRAAAYLARQPQDKLIPVGQIARAESIPLPFLSRILYQLAQEGLLSSRTGPGGGFQLTRSAKDISLRDIVAVVDGLDGLQQCAVGLARCSDEMPCPLHDMWKELRGRIAHYLEITSLADMAHAVERKRELMVKGKG